MFRIASLVVLGAFLASQVVAVPLAMPAPAAVVVREPAPFEPIPAYVKRQNTDINNMPAEIPTKGVNGQILPFNSRVKRQNVPDETPVNGVNGNIVPFHSREQGGDAFIVGSNKAKRQNSNVNNMPAEIPTKGVNGQILPFNSRVKRQDVPDETPVNGVNGNIVPFNSRDELAGGAVIVGSNKAKRQNSNVNNMPAEIPTKGVNGQILPFNN